MVTHVDTDSGWLSRLSKTEACENIVQQVDVYEAQDIGAWLKKLGSSQASDLAPVVRFAYHCQCVKPSCNDCSVLRPQQREVRSEWIRKGYS